jgi:hypothetical protein
LPKRAAGRYPFGMRRAWSRLGAPALAAYAMVACSTRASDAPSDAGEAAAPDDGSTAPCTTMGGTCVPYTQACPVPQQNTELCGSTVLLCCLPDSGVVQAIPPPADAAMPEAAPPEGGTDDGETPADSEVADSSDW